MSVSILLPAPLATAQQPLPESSPQMNEQSNQQIQKMERMADSVTKMSEADRAQMEAVRSLLPRFEATIQRVLDRVWGSDPHFLSKHRAEYESVCAKHHLICANWLLRQGRVERPWR